MSALGSYITHIEELQNALTKRNAHIAELEKRRDIYIDTGVRQEQERIIKLLETERWELPDGSLLGGEVYMPLEQAIALIKGENK